MTEWQKTGRMGEDIALEYLLQDGFKLLERNWYCRHKEIDLIMEHGDGIHIVEVKTRREPAGMEPEQAVDLQKQQRLETAARAFLKARDTQAEIHFDIVSIILDREHNIRRISFIRDAFFPIWNKRQNITI